MIFGVSVVLNIHCNSTVVDSDEDDPGLYFIPILF